LAQPPILPQTALHLGAREARGIELRATPAATPPSKLLLALEGGRASLEQAIEGALGRIPEASHHIRKLWATDQDAFCNHFLRLDVDGRHDRFAMGVSDNFIRKYAELCFTMPGSIFGFLMTNCEAQASSG
jgi:hypothetical protein